MVCLKQDTEIGSLSFHVRGDKDQKLSCGPCGLWGKGKLFKDFTLQKESEPEGATGSASANFASANIFT